LNLPVIINEYFELNKEKMERKVINEILLEIYLFCCVFLPTKVIYTKRKKLLKNKTRLKLMFDIGLHCLLLSCSAFVFKSNKRENSEKKKVRRNFCK
jgi:hypothetical protein